MRWIALPRRRARSTQPMNGQDHAVALRVIRNGEPVFVGIQMGQNQAGLGLSALTLSRLDCDGRGICDLLAALTR